MDPPAGPARRRGRWHEFLSKFDLHVTYIPGRYNTVAEALSRWAYPASEAYSEVSSHGTSKDKSKVGRSSQDWGCSAGGSYQGAFAHPPRALLHVPPPSRSPT